MSQILKTPLRYPGGKSRAVPKLANFIPNLDEYHVYREPFLGGGSVALWVTQKYPNLRVWVNDLYEPLVNFWKVLQDDGDKLRYKLVELKSRYPDRGSAKGLFLEAKEIINDREKSHLDRAISFYIANKCSFSGLTESSSFSAQASDSNFSMRGIEKLRFYQYIIRDWTITNYDYAALLDDNRQAFVYLDPPYDIKDNLYGKKGNMHRGFDHDKFAHICDNYVCRQLVSYNATQMIKDRFQDWIAAEFDHTYTLRSVGDYMKDQHERKELVLMNYEV
jgi:DNA adenine methylase Dam